MTQDKKNAIKNVSDCQNSLNSINLRKKILTALLKGGIQYHLDHLIPFSNGFGCLTI